MPETTSAITHAKVETWEDHVEAWHHFGRVAEGAIWGRAAVAASLRGRYGEGAMERFAAEVGQTARRIRQLAQVSEAYPENGKRFPDLSLHHHLVALSAADPAAALQKAEAEGWSTRALDEYVRAEAARAAPTPSSAVVEEEDDDWDCTITLTVPHSALPAVERALRSIGFAGSPTRSRKMKLTSSSALKGAA